MRGRYWVWNPHAGGVKIPDAVRQRTEERIRHHAEAKHAGRFSRLDVRFRGALCYIDAYAEPEPPTPGLLRATGETREELLDRVRSVPHHLCRLRYFGNEEKWSLAFYTYSNERYEPCTFHDGSFQGAPEAAFDIGSVYLPAAQPAPSPPIYEPAAAPVSAVTAPGDPMPASPTAAIDTAINQLQAQLENLQAQVRALEEARAIVTGKPLPATKGPKRAAPQKSRPAKKKRRLSAAGREAISKAAKARWARIKAEKAESKLGGA